MAKAQTKAPMGPIPTHPGVFLKTIVLPEVTTTLVELAALLGISRMQLNRILNGAYPVSPPMAIKLGRLFNTTPESWLNMQIAHDLAMAERELGGAADQLPVLPRKEAA